MFAFEVVIKIIAYGLRYFKDGWNAFDVGIVFITLLSMILAAKTNVKSLGPSTTVIRSFKISRVFKLFRRNKSLKLIFQTFMLTLPAIVNIGTLLLLIFFIYAILGVY